MTERFSDEVQITEVNPDGKKFSSVLRCVGRSQRHGVNLILDLHSPSFRLIIGETVRVRLIESDGKTQRAFPNARHVLHGRVFKVTTEPREVTCSFGGLLLSLSGLATSVSLPLNTDVYLVVDRPRSEGGVVSV